jgi:outer membrane protein, protease secretion system
VARARLSDAAERVGVATARLNRLTGRLPAFVNDTPNGFLPRPSEPGALREWTASGALQNPAIEVRQATVDAARFGVKRNQAGHLPRVDLVANLARSRNESLSNLDQSSNLRSLGVQVSLPLFSGFGVQAAVRQSEAELARAQEDLRNERENNELEIRRLLQAADAAAVRAEALRKAVEASEVSVTGSTRAQEAGLATQTDVLEARRGLFAVRRELAQSHYDHLAARMRVMVLAGEPMQRIVDQIDAMLTERMPLNANQTQPTR